MAQWKMTSPLKEEDVAKLKSGDLVLLNGVIYTGRDAAHKRLVELIEKGEQLPVDFDGQVIYYVGPSPAKPGNVIGSAGPTTSGRMDAYAPELIKLGLKGMIGKGSRNQRVIDAIKEYHSVYMAATGGAAALIAKKIKRAEVVAYPELGPEAIYRLEVEDFPVTVVNDIYGGDLYLEGIKKHGED